ncbi:linoleate diol synthase [Rhodotorula diobovata]|uniref:linoleate 8R-lipoxygenase n=1 Tax=Rhodotorula diobovata TaxID=5288 RepID=A0A5C5G3N3_9BASI|nr:linoleate diol synthase [Rhodotorula diobovata]
MSTQRPTVALPGGPATQPDKGSLFGSVRSRLQRNRSSESSVSTLVESPTAEHPPSTPGAAAKLKTLFETIASPPPPAGGDGLKDSLVRAPGDPAPVIPEGASFWQQVTGGTVDSDTDVAIAAIKSGLDGPVNDREMLLERVVTMLQGLPDGSPVQQPVTDALIKMLWDELHAEGPRAFAGPQYRSANGSGNSLTDPALGAAGTPYARTVPPCHPKMPNAPDAGVVFDALLRRREFRPHPSGISSLLFAFATLITHDAFNSSRTDPHINETSSYLDLSPIYGCNQREQDTVRSYSMGMLFPDAVAASRLFFQPPSVVALAVIFSRNHNFIADKLFSINESGRYKPENELDDASRKWQDNDLFQRARLVNCGWFLGVVVNDYIRVILNCNTTTSLWSLMPTADIANSPTGHAPRGTGNCSSAEFSILYRWHAAISQKDERWVEELFESAIGDKSVDEMTGDDFKAAVGILAQKAGPDPRKWETTGLKRDATSGRFNDDDLTRVLTEATDEVAGAFGAKHVPSIMRIIDMMGINSSRRDWAVCTLNEFRRFLHLKPFESFEEWNSDPEVAATARHLYTHPDNLELFAGLHAEEAKPSQSGSGLAVGYTISRAILSDATSLVRGDRFFTTDFNAATLTSWGYQDVQGDPQGGSYGGLIGRLLMRNLPHNYTARSTYALFPFSTPATMQRILTKNGVVDKYDLRSPTTIPPVHGIFTYQACLSVLADPSTFGVIYAPHIEACSNSYGYMLTEDDVDSHRRDRTLQAQALFVPGWQDRLADFYRSKTASLIAEASWTYDGGRTRMLDVVRDVTNLTAVYWCSHQFGMPLKTATNPHGVFTPAELYMILSAFFISVFMNFDASAGFKLGEAAKEAAPALLSLIRMRLKQVKGVPSLIDDFARSVQDRLLGKDVQAIVLGKEAHAYYERLLSNKDVPTEKLASSVQSTMTASVSNQGQATAHVINFFLSEENAAHKAELVRLCLLDTVEANTQILAYVTEALRLDPQVPLIPRVAKRDVTIRDGERVVEVKKGDSVYPSMLKAGMDPTVFPDPERFDPERASSLYRLFGHGMHTCLGAPIINVSLVQMVKQVFSLKNVRRAPGKAGELVRFHQELGGTPCPVYLSENQTMWPLPVSLSIVYDGDDTNDADSA